jgi:hypothetical protein
VEYSLDQDEPWLEGTIIPNINQFPILNMNEASKELEIPFHKVSFWKKTLFPKKIVSSECFVAKSKL